MRTRRIPRSNSRKNGKKNSRLCFKCQLVYTRYAYKVKFIYDGILFSLSIFLYSDLLFFPRSSSAIRSLPCFLCERARAHSRDIDFGVGQKNFLPLKIHKW